MANRREPGIIFDHMTMGSNKERQLAKSGVACAKPVHLPHMPRKELWAQYRKYRFGVSPRGNGLDCHRTWEMLYFGMIPIVES